MSVSDPQLRIVQLESELKWAHLKIQVLEEKLRQQRIRMLGPQSETLSNLQLELLADEEPGATSDEVAAEAKRETLQRKPARERKPHPGRERLPENLPRVETVIPCADPNCSQCGKETAIIGYDISEQLDVEPARYLVRIIKREKRVCRGCEQSAVTMPPLEERIVEKGLASDRVVVETVVNKYCDHLPLYRQAEILEREAGLEIGRATLDGWVMRVGELLIPVTEAMRKDLLSGRYLQADETTVPVQMHDGRGKNHEAYLWQYGKPGGETVFDFCLHRGREGPKRFLGDWEGILQTDGYQAYDGVGGPKLAHVGCWAHYLDSCIIQSECEMDAPGRDGSGVSGTLTPDKASQAFEEREQFRRWPPLSRRRGVESRSPPECLQHIALHLKIGRNVSACHGHRCMAEVISNHRNIDPCLQKGNGTTVSHDVWSDSALS
jgi:transposase